MYLFILLAKARKTFQSRLKLPYTYKNGLSLLSKHHNRIHTLCQQISEIRSDQEPI